MFRDVRCLILPEVDGRESRIPFDHAADRLYRWEVAAVGRSFHQLRSIPLAGASKGGGMVSSLIRDANSQSHVSVLGAEDVGRVMHGRLHLSSAILRRLPSCTSDAPGVLRRCPKLSCDACTEANASRLSRSHASGHQGVKPRKTSRPGQVVHADIAGPFRLLRKRGLPVCPHTGG